MILEDEKKMGFIADILVILFWIALEFGPVILIAFLVWQYAKKHPGRSRFDDNADAYYARKRSHRVQFDENAED